MTTPIEPQGGATVGSPAQTPEKTGTTPAHAPRGLSLFVKLAIVILSLVVGSITLLAFYLSSRQLDDLRVRLDAKASTYGRLVSKQVEPAVAFNDLQTAREIFDSVAQDTDIDALTLFTDKGASLYARGVGSVEMTPARLAASSPELVDQAERVASVVPVVSLEGPRGVLVVEVSKRRLGESRRTVLTHAGVAALLTMVVGGFGAYLIARSLARRLEAMATVADKVAAGDLDQGPVDVGGSRDEIGRLGVAINAMLNQIRALFAQIRESAQKEQERLEGLVAARTAELATRNVEMRRVLDNVGQGVFSLDANGHMSRERSAIVERWFGAAPQDASFAAYLTAVSPRLGQWFALGWESVTENILPLEVSLDQLPKRMDVGDRNLELDYRPVTREDGALECVLVVVSDVTAEMERERAEAGEREMTRLFSRLIADRAGTVEFFSEARTLVNDIVRPTTDAAVRKRALHTLKGNAGIFGLDTWAAYCHGLEDILSERGALTELELAAMNKRWQEVSDKVQTLVSGTGAHVEIPNDEYDALVEMIESAVPHAEIRQAVSSFRLEPAETRLRRIGEQATALAGRLQKAPLEVHVEANGLKLEPLVWAEFWSAAVHVVRNAVDHGLETPEEREELGKTEPATLHLRTHLNSQRFTVEFADNGRGIDWEKVAGRAKAMGLPVTDDSDLATALFAEGFTTRETVSEMSGRGVGLPIVRAACRKLGGDVEIDSELGKGTTFRFVWPAHVVSGGFRRSARVLHQPPISSKRWRPSQAPSAGT